MSQSQVRRKANETQRASGEGNNKDKPTPKILKINIQKRSTNTIISKVTVKVSNEI